MKNRQLYFVIILNPTLFTFLDYFGLWLRQLQSNLYLIQVDRLIQVPLA